MPLHRTGARGSWHVSSGTDCEFDPAIAAALPGRKGFAEVCFPVEIVEFVDRSVWQTVGARRCRPRGQCPCMPNEFLQTT